MDISRDETSNALYAANSRLLALLKQRGTAQDYLTCAAAINLISDQFETARPPRLPFDRK